jgi:hypothetical protein
MDYRRGPLTPVSPRPPAEPLSEQERHDAYRRAAANLPEMDMSGWVWTDEEVAVLRKACAKRFDETLRTESLFSVAVAGMRLLKAREAAGF